MARTAVYSWRLALDHKARLEDAARRRQKSLSALLDEITETWLRGGGSASDEATVQAQLRSAALRHVGQIEGADPSRSARVSELVRERLRGRRERPRTD